MPTIVAGIRTAAVWTIGAATLSTTVGQPSLGDLIFAGLQTLSWPLVLVGCAASAALALTVDGAIGLAQWGVAHGRRVGVVMAASLLAVLLLGSFMVQGAGSAKANMVTIGTKGFTEQLILSRLIGARLEHAGYGVRYRDNLGSAIAFGAVSSGDADLLVDYSGTLWTNQLRRNDNPGRASMIEQLSEWMAANSGARLVGPLGFENAYAFAVRPDTAAGLHLVTLEDLASVASRLTLGTDPEFLERPEWATVRRAYDLRFGATRSLNPGFLYDALGSGQADVITAYTSDGRVAADHLVVLADPRGAMPAYDALLLVNRARMGDGQLMQILSGLVGRIRVEDMRTANFMVDRADNKATPDAAAVWLAGRVR